MNEECGKTTNSDLVHAWYCSSKGDVREEMQDAMIVSSTKHGDRCYDVFAVMDGHGTVNTVRYCHTHLMTYFNAALSKTNSVRDALKLVFKRLDHETNEKNIDGGTTLSMVVYDRIRKKTFCANVGDSAVHVVRVEEAKPGVMKHKILRMSHNHNVNARSEKRRVINSSDHYIADGYVCTDTTSLAMTRAIGDHDVGKVIMAEPYVREVSNPNYIIIASDGIWDVMTREEVWDVCKVHTAGNPAKSLIEYRDTKYEQHDNSSIIFVSFTP